MRVDFPVPQVLLCMLYISKFHSFYIFGIKIREYDRGFVMVELYGESCSARCVVVLKGGCRWKLREQAGHTLPGTAASGHSFMFSFCNIVKIQVLVAACGFVAALWSVSNDVSWWSTVASSCITGRCDRDGCDVKHEPLPCLRRRIIYASIVYVLAVYLYSILNLPKQTVSRAVDSHNLIHEHGHPIPTARKTIRIRPRPPHPSRRRATTPHQPRTDPQHQPRMGHPRPQRPRLLEQGGLAASKTHHFSVARSLGFEIRSVSDDVAR